MKGYRRNGALAREGIDTGSHIPLVSLPTLSRNGALAREGIDTILLHMKSSLFASGRNGALAREGIDTLDKLSNWREMDSQ